jgi:transposase, IS5 family
MTEELYPATGTLVARPWNSKTLRMYLLRQWYVLANQALVDAIQDSHTPHNSARNDVSPGPPPNATMLLKFRRPLQVAKT